jgi:hypothetical protein
MGLASHDQQGQTSQGRRALLRTFQRWLTGRMSEPKPKPSKEDLETYDLNEDGKISLSEVERARLGAIDARLEERAEEPGIRGKIAGLVHKVLDKFDNDG